jgi:hypothetical protein
LWIRIRMDPPHHFWKLDPDPRQGNKPGPDPNQIKKKSRSRCESASKGNLDPDPLKPFRVKKLIFCKI